MEYKVSGFVKNVVFFNGIKIGVYKSIYLQEIIGFYAKKQISCC